MMMLISNPFTCSDSVNFLVGRNHGQRHRAALGFDASRCHLCHLHADVNLRDSVNALRLQRPVVYPRILPCPLKDKVHVFFPRFAQTVDFVFLPDFSAHVVRHQVEFSRLVP
jgi:hypothetical protein